MSEVYSGAYSCAKRAADPSNQCGACRAWCGNAETCIRFDPAMKVAPDPLEAAAMKLAASFDYPWEHMPEAGRKQMRQIVTDVLAVFFAAKAGEPKCVVEKAT